MCFEFFNNTQLLFTERLNTILPTNNYFIVVIANKSYVYTPDHAIIDIAKGYMLMQGIVINNVSNHYLSKIIETDGPDKIEVLYGSKSLFDSFKIYSQNIKNK